ncbi:MAG: QacE [Proteobacteria bacterium]|nr:QacE [Pseudomonadota bacterium]
MSEKSYFKNEEVSVSTTRFQVPGTTYPVNGITSVTNFVIAPKRGLPIVLGILGLAFLFMENYVFGLSFLGVAILIWFLQKTKYAVRISTAGGQVDAIISTDQAEIGKIVTELNEAIIERG